MGDFNSKKIFIGNLPFTITKTELEGMFNQVRTIHLLAGHIVHV